MQAAIHRDNLLVSHSQKRNYSSGSSDEGDWTDGTEAAILLLEAYRDAGLGGHDGTPSIAEEE